MCVRTEQFPSWRFPASSDQKGIFQLSSLHNNTKACVSLYYRVVVEAQRWTRTQSFQTWSLQHILSCAQLFDGFIWNLSFCWNKQRDSFKTRPTRSARRRRRRRLHNEGATKATFVLLTSQSKLLKLILSSVMKNKWLVFDIVGKTNKEKFALIRKISEPCSRI